MKILHINSNYTYTTLHRELIEELDNLNSENTIFMAHNGKSKSVIDITQDKKVHSLKTFKEYDRYFYFLKQKKINKMIQNTIKIKDFDIIHAHTLFTDGYTAYKLYKKYNIPYVITVRNTDVNSFFKKRILLRNIGVEILKNASNIVFLSKTYLQEVSKKYLNADENNIILNKAKIIPNGVHDIWHKNNNISKKKDGNTIKIIYVGRINKNKNIISTVKACEVLIENGFKVNFKVVGDIEDYQIYSELVKKNFVEYETRKSRLELIDEYQDNDIFVMPSIYESFGLVYAEAMTQGLPVIYTRNQGFDEQFENGTVGYSVDPYDYKLIADYIIKIWNNYETFSYNSITNSKKFDWKIIAERYYSIYSEIKDSILN